MKTIGIDCRFASTQSGLGRYTRELVTELVQNIDSARWVIFVRSANEVWLSPFASKSNLHIEEANFAHYSLTEHIRFPRVIRSCNLDLFFSPHFNVPLRCPVPFVITIHDLILSSFPNEASIMKQLAYRFLMRSALKRASKIIAVSNFTASELIATYGKELQSRIQVIHEGVSGIFQPASEDDQERVRKLYDLERPFFLYVGNAKQHKNVPMLIDAFGTIRVGDDELLLVTQGKEVKNLRLAEGVRILSEVSEADLPALYSAAISFVTPSLYEGFCLPLAEAGCCGARTVAVECGIAREVAGPSTILVRPNVLEIAEGLKQSKTTDKPAPYCPWSWAKAAEQTLEVLLSCIK